jgi:hypothetical protein
MQQEGASAMNKNSTSGVETGASIKPVNDLEQESGQAVQQAQGEENSSSLKQGEDQQKEGKTEDPSLQGLPSAQSPTDFLPFRRAMEGDAALE